MILPVSLITTTSLGLVLLASASLAQPFLTGGVGLDWSPSQPEHVFSHVDPAGRPAGVDLADRGTQVFTGVAFGASPAALFSSHDHGPPQAIWSGPAGTEQAVMTDTASLADVHAVVTSEETGVVNERIHRLHRFSSAGLAWTYTWPELGAGRVVVGVSEHGHTLAAALPDADTGAVGVLRFAADSAVPVQSYQLPAGVIWSFDLSADGTRAAFTLGSTVVVLDLDTGVLHELFDASPLALSEHGVSLSGDGSVLAANLEGRVAVFHRVGGLYDEVWSRATDGTAVVDVSRDGATLVYGVDFGYESHRTLTECVDLESGAILVSEDITTPGLYSNGVSDVAITDDGRLFVTATWGDEADEVPEVRVYSRERPFPVQTWNLPGSALEVDISPDGLWVAVGSAPVHTNLPSVGGRFDLFHLGGAELTLEGAPRIGESVVTTVHGPPGSPAFLLTAPHAAEPPLPVPPHGTLFLDPAGLTVTPMGTIGVDGTTSLQMAIPDDPALVGVTRHHQGLTNQAGRVLTRTWLVVTPLP